MQGSINSARIFNGDETLGLVRSFVDPNDLSRLQNPHHLLNDVCVNVSSTIIHSFLLSNSQTHLAASKCTVFSTYVMKYIQDGRSDEEIWRNTKSNLYWQADVWVVPIHLFDMRHWILCTLYVKRGQVLLFDSFAERKTLQSILPVGVVSVPSMCSTSVRNYRI